LPLEFRRGRTEKEGPKLAKKRGFGLSSDDKLSDK
jgi:hypothetical protein